MSSSDLTLGTEPCSTELPGVPGAGPPACAESPSSEWATAGEVPEFVRRTLTELGRVYGHDRRGSERRQVAIPVTIRPLDATFEPLDRPVEAVTRDLSIDGLSFYHIPVLDCEFAEVRFRTPMSGQALAVVIELCHSTNVGAFQLTGAQFLIS